MPGFFEPYIQLDKVLINEEIRVDRAGGRGNNDADDTETAASVVRNTVSVTKGGQEWRRASNSWDT